ncbi:MAG: glycosyltransferase, partial [Arthrobacter sp.]|nr:glycosyltransferase [Arthrobacter sp.]
MTSIRENLEIFDDLVRRAESLVKDGALEEAAVQSQMAARFAWLDHTGLFASSELEAVVAQLRSSLARKRPRGTKPHDGRLNVVHVATQLYGAGGHTQTISCWIRQDSSSRHRLILTRQGSTPVPEKISDCLPESRAVQFLDRAPGGLLRRAETLKKAVEGADAVIVHAHPDDVVPAIALGTENSPPAVFVNHADHVFWVGTSAANVVLNFRRSGEQLSIARRGIDPSRCILANRPLELAPGESITALRRSELRARWGVADDDFLVVSAAAASKYDSVGTESLIELFRSFLGHHANARLLVAGPSSDGLWAEADAATNGRIRAVGRLSDIAALLSAADVYVDSFPFASLTSLLEAGAHGIPLVTYRGHPADCDVLGADSPGIDGILLTPSSPLEFVATLTSLAESLSVRAGRGSATRSAVLAGHSLEAWNLTVSDVYAQALRLATKPSTRKAIWQDGTLDQLVALVQQQTGFGGGVGAAEADVVSLRPPSQRLRLWTGLKKSQPMRASQLLPEWTRPHVAGLRRTVRAIRRNSPPDSKP